MKNLEAKRALFAFNVAQKGNTESLNYSAAVQELPAMLRMNGLRATMAYYYSKKKQHGLVFKQIRDWFRYEESSQIIQNKFQNNATQSDNEKNKLELSKSEADDFMKILLELSDHEYRIAQAETMVLANWLIRFVKTEKLQENGKS